ncbi:hypothetical protein ACMWQD_30015, partial [Escherichia coli]|uniref:hypothetical protein n=1 Tax=Escherichia coli TaxID=562 RepID=UPI0039E129EE
WRAVALWRGATAASLALAASLGIVVVLEARDRPAGPATALVAFGQKDAVFVAERLASGAVDVRPIGSV